MRRMGGWAGGRMVAAVLTHVAAIAVASPLSLAGQYPTTPPPAASLRPLQFPPFQETALPSGLRLLVVENHELPVVSLSLALPAGTRFDPAAREGLADLVAELLTKGTERRTADQISATIEGVGSSLSAAADADFLLLSTTVLTEHLDLAFDLVGDVTLHATFPESELELARTRTLSQLRIEQSTPEALGNRFFTAAIYGSHPYGRRPSETSVKAIGAAEVRAFAAQRLRPGGGLLVLSGDVTLQRARELAMGTFGTWTGAPPAALAPPAPPARKPTEILLVHRPGSQQSNILIGNLAQRAGDPLYYPSVIANRIVGGGADARLFLILREQKGWTYGAFSRIVRHRDRGHFMANAEVRTPVTDSALVELLRQLRRIRTETVADSELVSAKGYLIGSFPRQIETPGQVAGQVTTVKLLGLGEDYLRTFRERLAAVTPADVVRGARHTIHPDSAVIVVVGDGQRVYEQLKAIAPVRIVDVDGTRLTPADLAPHAGPLALDRAQLVSRADSFRILAQGAAIGAMADTLSVQGDALVYTRRTAIGPIVDQRSVVTFDARTLAMRRSDQTGTAQGQTIETHLTYSAGRVRGRAVTPQPDGGPRTIVVDTTVADGTIDDNAVSVIVPALQLEAGRTFRLNVFSSGEGVSKLLTVKVAGTESVTVPAGTFDAYRLELAGMQLPLVMYVSRATPRRMVKLELVGTPLVYELVK